MNFLLDTAFRSLYSKICLCILTYQFRHHIPPHKSQQTIIYHSVNFLPKTLLWSSKNHPSTKQTRHPLFKPLPIVVSSPPLSSPFRWCPSRSRPEDKECGGASSKESVGSTEDGGDNIRQQLVVVVGGGYGLRLVVDWRVKRLGFVLDFPFFISKRMEVNESPCGRDHIRPHQL